MQMYIQWSSDNSYNSSNQKLIIECLPHFEKLALSPLKVYIEVETMTHCYVCDNCQMSIFIQSDNVKEGVICILQMLSIHTGLRKWNKNNIYHIHIRENNPIGIDQPCIKIANSEVLFEIYIMALMRDKYAIDQLLWQIVCIHIITFSHTFTHSNLFLFTTACFTT